MRRLNWDLETNGLLTQKGLKVHCMGVIDVDTGEEFTFVNREYRAPADGTLEDGLELLDTATEHSGHNLVGFDLPVLEMCHGWKPKAPIYDTYIGGMLHQPDMKDVEMELWKRNKRLGKEQPIPGNLLGQQNLDAWGYRLGIHKGSYGKNRTDWSTFDLDMLRYCIQDVRVAVALRKYLEKNCRTPDSVQQTEQDFARIMMRQQLYGFPFKVKEAEELLERLQKEQSILQAQLQDLFPPKTVVCFTPKKKLRREKVVAFNPNSRTQIADNLIERYGWKPKLLTKGGSPKVDEKVLESLDYPEAKVLSRAAMLAKRTAQISTGKQGWLKKVSEDGRIHARVVNVGTPHGRCGHSSPNLAQVVSDQKEFGHECRSLFHGGKGMVMLGADASGIQLRGLGHYLADYDDGNYIDVILNSDPHTTNQEAAGLETRAKAKRFIYAFLFGAGKPLIGEIITGRQDDAAARVGAKTITRFLDRLPGIKDLLEDLGAGKGRNKRPGWRNTPAYKGWMRGLDRRYVPLTSSHVALNFLLTSFEAAVMKLATVRLDERMRDLGYAFGEDYANLAHVHDEYQFAVKKALAKVLGEEAIDAIRWAGEQLGSKCPLAGEYKTGPTWAETH